MAALHIQRDNNWYSDQTLKKDLKSYFHEKSVYKIYVWKSILKKKNARSKIQNDDVMFVSTTQSILI